MNIVICIYYYINMLLYRYFRLYMPDAAGCMWLG